MTRDKNRGSSPTVSVDLVKTLREEISNHTIAPGTRLQELALADEYGVSRSQVREALLELELRGLVKRVPNRGVEVLRLDLTQVFEIFEAREALEGMCVRLATEKADSKVWQKWVDLWAIGGPMEELVNAGDVEEYFHMYEQLRLNIIHEARNGVIAGMLDSLMEKTRVIMRRGHILPGRASIALMEQRRYIEAMRSGNAEEAEQLRRENIRSSARAFERYKSFII